MSLYDDGNPQHLEYRDRWRAIGNNVTESMRNKAPQGSAAKKLPVRP